MNRAPRGTTSGRDLRWTFGHPDREPTDRWTLRGPAAWALLLLLALPWVVGLVVLVRRAITCLRGTARAPSRRGADARSPVDPAAPPQFWFDPSP